jgi:hypothetical protein
LDLLLCAYYLNKGIDPEKILELTPREKIFYTASMVWYREKFINGGLNGDI